MKRGTFCHTGLAITLSDDAALVGHLADENGIFQIYYDQITNLTSLADTNATICSAYDTLDPSSDMLNWTDANSWVPGLDIGGIIGRHLLNTLRV